MKYEYTIELYTDRREVQKFALNKMGQDGWRLVKVEGSRLFYFMREVNDEH